MTKQIHAGVTRTSVTRRFDLQRFQSLGHDTVVFVANLQADPSCEQYNGNLYSIEELLAPDMGDDPIFWISHPNCRCKFDPYGKVPEPEQQNIETKVETPPATTTTTTPGLSTTPTTQQPAVNKSPWYKKWMPWLFKNKASYRQRIMKRAKLNGTKRF
jgi:hypothetical protein